MKTTKERSKLPNFVQLQCEIIDDLQKRVNQLNKDFEIEKNCKNQVYEFLIKRNHFEEYRQFNKENPVKY